MNEKNKRAVVDALQVAVIWVGVAVVVGTVAWAGTYVLGVGCIAAGCF